LLYAAAALALFLQRPSYVVRLFASVREPIPPVQEPPCECGREDSIAIDDPESQDPRCRECGWRVAAIEAGIPRRRP
jgi:hypothetical protein